MAKPGTKLPWATSATGLANSSAPPSGKILDGWAVGEHPPAQWWNSRWNLLGQWVDWLDAFEATARTWTALQTFAAGLTVSAGAIIFPAPVSQVINASGGASPAYNTGVSAFSLSAGSRYWKDADGCVNVRIAASYSGSTTSHYTLFTLPVGFRPTNTVGAAAGNAAAPGNGGYVYVGSNGAVFMDLATSSTSWGCWAFLKFHPAD